jgi:hypothetical protein
MPTTPCMTHSHGTLPTFRTRDFGEVFISNGCVQRQGPQGIETLAYSADAEAWLRQNVRMSETLAVCLANMRHTSHATPGSRLDQRRMNVG